MDQPVAALLDDLAQRGMLEDTLVLFGSEFGRLPKLKVLMDATTTLLVTDVAGRGWRESGYSYGATDEYGREAVEGRMHTNDLHATITGPDGLGSRGPHVSVRRPTVPPDGRGWRSQSRDFFPNLLRFTLAP